MTDSNVTETSVDNSPIVGFDDLELLQEVQDAISDLGYQVPSPIQAKSIPYLLDGKDILAVAQTGTGKTAAFALPLLGRIDVSIKSPQLLVLAPTRELAIQVAEAFKSYAKNIKGFKVLPIYGGQEFRSQLKPLERGVHVVVGTPGRVMDHMRRKTLKLDAMKALVLDEADEMLRMGFIDDVEWVLEQMPKGHQTALFSATMPAPIKKIASKYLNNPAEVMIKLKTTTAETIRQRFLQVKGHEKADTLCHILEAEEFDAAIVFVRTKNATIEVAEKLQNKGFKAEALNGDIAQNQREKTVNHLKRGNIDIIVATDVAARGLDVDRISHVFNFDVPFDTESYVHRIGRTGRAGREGEAILFVTSRERNMLGQIERATKQKIANYEFPSLEVLNKRKIENLITKLQANLDGKCDEYDKLIGDLLEASDYSVEDLLLAFAAEALGNKPFYAKPFTPSSSGRERSRDKDRGRDRDGDRGDRKDKRRRDNSDGKNYKDMPMERYRLSVGSEHGVEKGNIVGAIANEAGISSQHMGKIVIKESHSFIDLPQGMPKDVFSALQQVWVKGQKLEITRDENQKEGAPRVRARSGDKPKSAARKSNGDKPKSTARKSNGDKPKSAARKIDGDKAPKKRVRKPKKES